MVQRRKNRKCCYSSNLSRLMPAPSFLDILCRVIKAGNSAYLFKPEHNLLQYIKSMLQRVGNH